ncbi:dihydrofolate reductase family protein [Aquipuribacter sp. SD81]|uniref:dihydrofolate reductase family protein n=1 Tax=Aquipuribacter sp. SD81 TaxID=3127703 RepID=UPI003019A956
MELTIHLFTSLDGVVQGPGSPDEDRSGGFDRGGWLVPLMGEGFGEVVDGWFARTGELLFGRRTYDLMQSYWPHVTDDGGLAGEALNARPKHVVTSHPDDLAPWQGAAPLRGDLVAGVRALKGREADGGGELQVHGCATLVQALLREGLVDEVRTLVFPTVVGAGKRLFEPGLPPSTWRLVEATPTASGAVAARYRPVAHAGAGEFVVEDGREVSRPA